MKNERSTGVSRHLNLDLDTIVRHHVREARRPLHQTYSATFPDLIGSQFDQFVFGLHAIQIEMIDDKVAQVVLNDDISGAADSIFVDPERGGQVCDEASFPRPQQTVQAKHES